ncbi:FtsX-like permease family protein [Marinicrinis lubricantis]|uniref:FtsX-like permease family protein n=1 Tax=Marinicrinis lubricantis TaxID=2086470 RepID=A0ABW1IRU0_9BACL
MSINHLIFRNLRKNLKHYYLYVFALIFSVALYFAFVTLQYDPSMDEVEGSLKGAAGIKAASVLLIAIVSIFLLYANNLFIKKRSKEIGLFRLIGMTKGKIFRILSTENFMLYFGSLVIGIFIGFSISKLVIMLLFKITGVEAIASLRFSNEALIQTLVVFGAVYVLIMIMNYTFIQRQTILALFRVVSSAEGRVKKISFLEMLFGFIGIALILIGYYVSSKLFDGSFTDINSMFLAMIFILGSVIIGTYLLYKNSVSFVSNIIRKSKGGYLNINQVMSLSSIMFRMKSNALLLTIITTVSALAIGLLSLSYISYYSAEKSAIQNVPNHFALYSEEDAQQLKQAFDAHGIAYEDEVRIEVLQAEVDAEMILASSLATMNYDSSVLQVPVISDKNFTDLDVAENEFTLTGYNDIMKQFMSLKDSGEVELKSKSGSLPLQYTGLSDDFIVSYYFTGGGLPLAIVDETTYEWLKQDLNPELQYESSLYIGLDLEDESQMEQAKDLFLTFDFSEEHGNHSQLHMANTQKETMGLVMFIVGFLGLTFLITSGCILYFKQMGESEDEQPNYTILRKLGFTQGDLLKGIQAKQLFSFGIPLMVGLVHSYFAVKSGWFFFGTELWTPMILVMVLYTGLYSIFGILSVIYSKKVIKNAL